MSLCERKDSVETIVLDNSTMHNGVSRSAPSENLSDNTHIASAPRCARVSAVWAVSVCHMCALLS